MRPVNLAKVAAEAEILRIQHMLKRQGVRAAFGLITVIFAAGVLALAHIVGWQVLRLYLAPIYATLILLGVDFLVTAIFGILAARSSLGRDERDALAIRQRALHEARSSLALGALIPIAGSLLRSRRNATQKKRPFWRRLRLRLWLPSHRIVKWTGGSYRPAAPQCCGRLPRL
jgi:hypothetical protein